MNYSHLTLLSIFWVRARGEPFFRFLVGVQTLLCNDMAASHEVQLNKHCRICGRLFKLKQYKYQCAKFSQDLMAAYNVNIENDSPMVHPSVFCNTCYTKMRQHENSSTPVHSSLDVMAWLPHTEGGDCHVCQHFTSQRKGGRPKSERKNRGRPTGSDGSNRALATAIQHRAPPSWKASQPLLLSRFLPPAASISLKDLQCPVCRCVVD